MCKHVALVGLSIIEELVIFLVLKINLRISCLTWNKIIEALFTISKNHNGLDLDHALKIHKILGSMIKL
jgi:hypothetical protein